MPIRGVDRKEEDRKEGSQLGMSQAEIARLGADQKEEGQKEGSPLVVTVVMNRWVLGAVDTGEVGPQEEAPLGDESENPAANNN